MLVEEADGIFFGGSGLMGDHMWGRHNTTKRDIDTKIVDHEMSKGFICNQGING